MELSPATVSNLVKGLRDQGLADIQPLNGRESLVALVSSEGAVVSVQVNLHQVRGVLFDFAREVRADLTATLDDTTEPGGSPRVVVDLIEKLVRQHGLGVGDLEGVAIGMQGPIARRTGEVASWARSQLPGWRDVAIEGALEESLRVPVVAENDANFAALAEWTWGAGRGATEFCYLMCSGGVGGGFVFDGKIFRGSDGLAGEVGHLVLDPNGPVCFCGSRGCLTTFVSERSLILALEASGAPHQSLPQIIDAARQGDPACRAVLWDAGRYLARAVVGTAKVVSPGVVAIGGTLASAGPLVFDSLATSVEMNNLRAVSPTIRVEPARLTTDATVFGGVAAVLSRLGRGISSLPDWMRSPSGSPKNATATPARGRKTTRRSA